MKNALRIVAQIAGLTAFSFGVNALTAWLRLPVPGSIIGIALLFTLLQLKVVKLQWVELGAKWLMAEMLLFFIPSAASMINYSDILLSSGPRLLLIMLTGTAAVMLLSGLVAQKLAQRRERSGA